MTEFGDLCNSKSCARELETVTKFAESSFTSWSYWQYKFYNDITTQAAPWMEGFYDING